MSDKLVGFDEVVIALKAGKKATCKRWNGKGMWIAGQFPDEHSKMSKPYLYIKTAEGDQVPWTASQGDILGDDWEILA